ncbi:ASPG asparaginase, partial [Polypterus senegalus]
MLPGAHTALHHTRKCCRKFIRVHLEHNEMQHKRVCLTPFEKPESGGRGEERRRGSRRMEKKEKRGKDCNAYKEMMSLIRSSLESQLCAYVGKQLEEGSSGISSNSVYFQTHVREGMIYLLQKWPDMKNKLHIMFNHPLPSEIRRTVWKLFLTNTKTRMEYLTRVSANKAKSVIERDIATKCKALLTSEETLRPLNDIQLAVTVMKNVLSYYHRLQHMKQSLTDAEYFLLIPLIQAAIDGISPSTSAEAVTTALVEAYITFLESRPKYMQSVSQETPDSYFSEIFEEVCQILENNERELTDVFQKIFAQQGIATASPKPKNESKMGKRRASKATTPAECRGCNGGLREELRRGLTSPEKPPGSNDPSKNTTMASVLKSQGPLLTVWQFQHVISKYFYKDLFSKLTKDEADRFPVLDPMQALLPPWTNLSSRDIPLRIHPKDRKHAREEREVQRLNLIQKKQQEEIQKKLKEESEISFGTPPPSLESKTPSQEHQVPTHFLQQNSFSKDTDEMPDATAISKQVNGRTAESIASDLLQIIMQTADKQKISENYEEVYLVFSFLGQWVLPTTMGVKVSKAPEEGYKFYAAIVSALGMDRIGFPDKYKETKVIQAAMFPYLMCSSASQGDILSVNEHIREGADVMTKDSDGRTPLHLAVASNKMEMVKFLLSKRANIHCKDNFGDTPLRDAIRCHLEMVEFLVCEGACLTIQSEELGRELCCLAYLGDIKQMQIWIAAGARLSYTDYDGRTPLHVQKDLLGNRPIDDARRMGYLHIANLLLQPDEVY